MTKLKINFVDFWGHFPAENSFLPILKKYFDVEINVTNPDVIIHTINGPNTAKYSCKKILFLGENYRASNYDSDYTISFDPHTPTNFRLPLWQYYLLLNSEIKNDLFNRIHHKSFERFCSFIVSNPKNFTRNASFDSLNTYKRIHSYGTVRNNDNSLNLLSKPGIYEDIPILSGGFWKVEKNKFLRNHSHKFALTYENAAHPYYITEKIMDGFLGGSLPIYWGSSKIEEDFNEKSFINMTKSSSQLNNRIKKIDSDQSLFNSYYEEPIFTDVQKQKLLENLKYFEEWLINAINK